jgi:ubiquinone/menaquinone biosynthesis C-methylase UbiE
MPKISNYIAHFSEKSTNYLVFRPDYPSALFNYLSKLSENHDTAWDCGTGTGKAALALAQYFKRVIATDSNETQLTVAPKKQSIHYYHWPAERTEIAATSVDLITVAQALHWFNLEAFYQEVRRVLKPKGILAAWCYSLGRLTPEIDPYITKLYSDILADCWPQERKWIDEHYQTIPFPFQKVKTPEFMIEKPLNFSQLCGYLQTWSAVKEYSARHQDNPVKFILNELKMHWGDPTIQRIMRWPIHLLVSSTPLSDTPT